MNTSDILKYGHEFFMETFDGLPETDWHTPNVCGVWSVKDIVAHVASFEPVLVDILNDILGDTGPKPALEKMSSQDPQQFNDTEVGSRQGLSVAAMLAEYTEGHASVMAHIVRVPAEKCAELGTIPAYGPEYSLDDFIVYSYYGHKREHGAQVAVFRDLLKAQ